MNNGEKAAAGEADTPKFRHYLSLFQGRGKVFLYMRRRFFAFFSKTYPVG
jgi:hypothetical protein